MKYKGPIGMLLIVGLLVFGFQNCGESEFMDGSSTDVEATNFNEDQLLELLDEAKKKIAALEGVNDEDHVTEAQRLAARLEASRNKIIKLMEGETYIGDTRVLSEVDMLVFLMSEAGDKLIMVDLDALKEEVAANRRKIEGLSAELAEFKQVVNVRLNQVDVLISNLEDRQDELNDMLNQLRADTELADLALRNALEDLRRYTETEVSELHQLNNKLAKDILAQKEALDKLFKSNEVVADLQGRMCTIGADGNVSDSREKCSSVDPENNTCCLTVEVVDCTTLFPEAEATAARAQCEIIIASIKNHDAQLQAIRKVDEKQTELIEGLINDVENLNQQTAILAEGQKVLKRDLQALSTKVNAIDARLLIVEFKAARAEAAASISERVDLTKAWVVQRQRDIKTRFCHANFKRGRAMFDYEAQRHNWNYCHHKLAILNQAMVSLQNISGMTKGIESLNVDGSCSAVINGKNVETLSIAELTTPSIFKQVNDKCNQGPALVKSRLLNAVKALATIAPDFRTVGYMKKKAKIAQLIFLGKPVGQLSQRDISLFADVNPMSSQNKATAFGRIEGIFKNKYVANILRDSSGRFPADIRVIAKARIPASNAVYSKAEIVAGANSYLKTLKSMEVSCSDCSWGVRGRSNAGSVNTGALKRGHRISYPKDIQGGLCPVQNDIVVLKSSDGKYFTYRITYDHAGREIVRPVIWGGRHVQFASNKSNFDKGLTRHSRFWNTRYIYKNGVDDVHLYGRLVLNVTKPYGRVYTGKGHCLHFSLAAPLKNKDWVAPNTGVTNLHRYLSGYSTASTGTLAKACRNNMGSKSKIRTVALTRDENRRMVIADSEGKDLATFNKRSLINQKNTQLGANYWVTKRIPLNYGSKEYPTERISSSNPFFGPDSTSTLAVRAWRRATANDRIVKQECTPNE